MTGDRCDTGSPVRLSDGTRHRHDLATPHIGPARLPVRPSHHPTGPCLNNGNAVNFLHGASVGPFIFLVQAEILAALRMLARGDLAPGMHEVPSEDRATIAATWLNYYNR
ncbi:hypothetical protein M271_29910 [Streptomyces rapamycinicus NRRL 5491]|uniref:Uncharacterized protein n=2 Tax=Streptomyces rapamycinicus TaxID=1226757 RepID=A0A0A0NKF9_STRRN|nr:hypothetical protein M271_29910 [Streptomyces rapamycinicus NRRL 5491]MBB4785079.1 hypothetical protein [Streptomyces rapamycinicus]RLV79446.1 hypothetical protein D3C57_113715 [Streptomyces rapamycinicus NRRL 5491]